MSQSDASSEAQTRTWTVWLGRAVKGIAAAVAVMSLISGVSSLSSLWMEYRDERAMTESSLLAARLMAETDVFDLAWVQLDQAANRVGEAELLHERVNVAMQWTRWLGSQSMNEQDYFEVSDRVLPYLYRGLADPGEINPQDIRAHIAWITYLADLAVATDVDFIAMLNEAIAEDPHNLYGHTMLGFLIGRSRGYEAFAEIVAHFDSAGSTGDVGWANDLQVSALGGLLNDSWQNDAGFAQSLPIAERYLASAVRQEVRNESSAFTAWLWDLGTNGQSPGQIETFDDLVHALEPDAYLDLLEDLYRHSTISRFGHCLMARLEEKRGDIKAAQDLLQILKGPGFSTSDRLDAYLDAELARLGATPQEAPEATRNYLSDVMPVGMEQWQFHADTLANFDPDLLGENRDDAVSFFETVEASHPMYATMRSQVKASRDRVKTYVDEGERWLLQSGGSEEAEERLVVPTWNLNELWWIVGLMAVADQDWDAAITEWTDIYPRKIEELTLDWELAVAHSTRAGLQPEGSELAERDKQQALRYLLADVQRLRNAREGIDWNAILSEPGFAAIRETAEFQSLVRGRE